MSNAVKMSGIDVVHVTFGDDPEDHGEVYAFTTKIEAVRWVNEVEPFLADREPTFFITRTSDPNDVQGV